MLAGLLLAAAAAAQPGLPPGMSMAEFEATRVDNLTTRRDGQGATCPPVRSVACGKPKAVGKGDFRGKAYACSFEQKTGKGWEPVKGMLTQWQGQFWDFDNAALKGCRYL